MSPLPLTSRPSEGPTWDIGMSTELVRQVAPVGWLWTPTPDQEGAGHHHQEQLPPHTGLLPPPTVRPQAQEDYSR